MSTADHPECGRCPLDGIIVTETVGGIDRRRFVARATIAAAAAVLAACGGGSDALGPDLSGSVTVTLAQYPTLATVGGVALVTSGTTRLAVVRTGAAAFIALSLRCPHEGTTVNSTATGFTCPNHGARFDVNGTWLGGQRTSNMRAYTTSFDATAGTVTIS